AGVERRDELVRQLRVLHLQRSRVAELERERLRDELVGGELKAHPELAEASATRALDVEHALHLVGRDHPSLDQSLAYLRGSVRRDRRLGRLGRVLRGNGSDVAHVASLSWSGSVTQPQGQ